MYRGLRPPSNMHIYLKHAVHGAKIAISDSEAEYDEKSGWTRYNPAAPAPEPEPPVNARKRKYTRKAETEEV